MLIDFNRSIDLKLFDNGTAFVTCVPKKELACVEMLHNRPWIFQVRTAHTFEDGDGDVRVHLARLIRHGLLHPCSRFPQLYDGLRR